MSSSASPTVDATNGVSGLGSGGVGVGGSNAYEQWLEQQEEQQQADATQATSSLSNNPVTSANPSLEGVSGTPGSLDSDLKQDGFSAQDADKFISQTFSVIGAQIQHEGTILAQALQKIGSDDPNSGIVGQ